MKDFFQLQAQSSSISLIYFIHYLSVFSSHRIPLYPQETPFIRKHYSPRMKFILQLAEKQSECGFWSLRQPLSSHHIDRVRRFT
jgi:hypothetical protein